MLPKISKNSVAGQCLSLLDDEAKATLKNKMEVALSKTMRAELKSTNEVRIGDWVEVDEDYSVGLCSEGGAGMIVELSYFGRENRT
jgi:hypothetical protein